MQAKELVDKKPEELEQMLIDLKKERFNLRMQVATGQVNNPHMFKQLRKDIARIKTVLNNISTGS